MKTIKYISMRVLAVAAPGSRLRHAGKGTIDR